MIHPPFRADHVGSLLRPPSVHAARAARQSGSIDADELRAIEDDAIREAVVRQEAIGLQAITDGEFRRGWFHLDFLAQLDGVTVTVNTDAATTGSAPPTQWFVGEPLRHGRDIQVDDFRFLRACTHRTPKVSIPSPSMIHFRGGRASVSSDVYPDLDQFWADLAAAYRAEIGALATAGCRYIQLDDTNLAYLCDPAMRAAAVERGDDPDELPHTYAQLINDSIRDRPADMRVGIHLCRGNFKSTFFAQGGYEPVAEVLFGELDVDAYFLEFDDDRSGDFAPLRHVPADKAVVLGLVTSKRPELEAYDEIARRVEEASAFVSMDQLCLSPQCGFASTVEGNALTTDEQWAKLGMIVDYSTRIWS